MESNGQRDLTPVLTNSRYGIGKVASPNFGPQYPPLQKKRVEQ